MSSSQPPLGSVPTGTALGSRLAGLDVRAMPDAELWEVLSGEARQLAHQQARVWAVMAELATRNPVPNVPEAVAWTAEQVFDAAVEEIRAELRLTRRGATAELQRAVDVHALPPVARALAAGRIDRSRAVVLAEGCADLTRAQQAKLLAAVLPGADRVTCTGLAARVRRVAMALDPGWAERRCREAIRQRRVISYLSEDGSATISAQGLPADLAALACARVAALANAAQAGRRLRPDRPPAGRTVPRPPGRPLPPPGSDGDCRGTVPRLPETRGGSARKASRIGRRISC
jgi:hypothetical protein